MSINLIIINAHIVTAIWEKVLRAPLPRTMTWS